MSKIFNIEGRSFFFNLLFVVFNLIGLSMVCMGFHDNFEEYKVVLIASGVALILLTSFLLLIFRGRLLMAGFSRVIVGSLCIVSGLVKANDPIGFSYKLEEYFEDGALAYRIKEMFGMPGFSLEFLIDYALILSVFICVLEIVLGVLLIIGGKIKTVTYCALLMMLFFTFLTWHTANCDPSKKFVDRDTYSMSDPMAISKIEEIKVNKEVTIHSKTADYLVVDELKSPQCVADCGCFGDALKGSVGRSLTPKESLWKDLILLYLVIWIFVAQWIILPNTRKQNLIFSLSSILIISFFAWVFSWIFPILFGILVLLGALWIVRAGGKFFGNYFGSTLIVALISLSFIAYVLMNEPLKDYRPFAVGSNLYQNMHNGKVGIFKSILVYENKKTGKIVEFAADSEEFKGITDWDNWKFIRMSTKIIRDTQLPSINDFDPLISLSDIGKEELKMKIIQNGLKSTKVRGLKMKDILNHSSFEIPFEEYNLIDYPVENYTIQDTIEIEKSAVSDISIIDFILKSPNIIIVFAKDLKRANFNEIKKFKSIQMNCEKNGIPFIMICSAIRSEINAFRKKFDFNVPVFVNDEKTIKTVSRSNPSLLVIKNGIVKGKYPHRSLPSFSWLNENILLKK